MGKTRLLSILDGDLEERIYELEAKVVQLRLALSDTLGLGNILNMRAQTLRRWYMDPNCNVPDEAQRIMDLRLKMHIRIVWVLHHGPEDTECFGHKPLHPGQDKSYCTYYGAR